MARCLHDRINIMFKSLLLAVLLPLTLATAFAFQDPPAIPRSRRARDGVIVAAGKANDAAVRLTAIGGNNSDESLSVRRGGGAATDGGARQQRRPGRRSQIVPIAVSLVIGFFSLLEIAESLREEFEFAVGHAHGIFLLSALRLSRGLAILQTETEELAEAVEKLRGDGESSPDGGGNGPMRRWKRSIARFFVSRSVGIAACILAIVASMIEVIDDMKPGAHHGSAFLALSELNYQAGRLTGIEGAGRDDGEETRTPERRLMSSLRAFVGPLLFVAAAAVSAMEVYEDTRPGAHHGVAILACAELVENLNRSEVFRRRRRRYFLFGPSLAY